MRLALALALVLVVPLAGAERVPSCAGAAGSACALLAEPPVPSEVEVPDLPVPGVTGLPHVEPAPDLEVPPALVPEVRACDLVPRGGANAGPLLEARLAALGFGPAGEALGRSLRELADAPAFCHQNVG